MTLVKRFQLEKATASIRFDQQPDAFQNRLTLGKM